MAGSAEAAAGTENIEEGDSRPPLNRMVIATLALVGVFISAYLLLHRLGYVGTLACGPGGGCGVVQTSVYAVFLGIPVPAWGVGGYLVILGVALAGLQPKFIADRRIAVSLLALAFVAFTFSIYLTALEAFVIGAWCRWCVASAAVTTLIFFASVGEIPRLRPRSREAE